ncbi:MAG: DUF3592 domain-containing protein [Clostridia bacterium]|nr:DUF3592 domain-containing protein [Clostridia bacterium]
MIKKLLKIQIIQTIFIVILLLVAILEKNGIMQREKSFMGFYIISCLIYWIILITIVCIIMHKNPKKEKKILKVGLVLSIEILLLAIFCSSVDDRVDMLEFTKHCDETTATVYNIDKEVKRVYRSDDYYGAEVIYDYWFEYDANGAMYKDFFYESTSVKDSRGYAFAKSKAEKIRPKYETGDEFTIYYNTENPEDWRRDIGYFPDNVLNIFAFIIIGLRGVILGKSIMDYNKEKKEEKNLV